MGKFLMALVAALTFAQLAPAAALQVGAPVGNVRLPLKGGWRFIKADDPKSVVDGNLTNEIARLSRILDCAFNGDLTQAPRLDWARPDFDDAGWESVRVPHDWAVRPATDANLAQGGIGWYRRSFEIRGEQLATDGGAATLPKNGKVYFECDGAMSYAMVWVNGAFVGGWPYGYTRWRVDLTPHLSTGANVLAVRCHNMPGSTRWYTGGGLYRNCRLIVCPEDHLVPGSLQIAAQDVTARKATIRVAYEMSRSGRRDTLLTVDNPRLWDVDDPYLYDISVEGETHRYGIRTIAFHADSRRFQLNGRTRPLNGVSMHHDFGVLGTAWNRTAERRRLMRLKEAGVNAVRSSHNPPDEGLLTLCDELGLLVKDEVFDEWRCVADSDQYGLGYTHLFDAWHERDTRAWVRTDRNHPCVVLYSIGNEICDLKHYVQPLAKVLPTARRMAQIVASEDPTRPTTNANNDTDNFTNSYARVLRVFGCNYFGWQYEAFAKANPDVPFYGSETVCDCTVRGEYVFPMLKRAMTPKENPTPYGSSYCWGSCGWTKPESGWACPADVQWHWMDKVGTCMGEFPWTGIDYLGGPDHMTRARKAPAFASRGLKVRASSSGWLDLAGFRKDMFWLYQSRYLPEKPMAHLLPHWNWAGREGKVTPVCVFTTGDEGELFLNGQSLGRQKKVPGVWDRAYRLCWDDVRYAPGRLEVVVYRKGREWARDVVETAGQGVKLAVSAPLPALAADGEDVAFVEIEVQDAAGRFVPCANNRVTFEVEGPGKVLAVDNGCSVETLDYTLSSVPAFNGRALGIVRAQVGAKGRLRITAKAEGLASAVVECVISERSDAP